MISMEDEESGAELRIISSSFPDPYLLVLREDSTVKLFKASDSGELEELECGALSSAKWLSASLFNSSLLPEIFAFLLTPDGGLEVCSPISCFGSPNMLQIFSMSSFEQSSYSA